VFNIINFIKIIIFTCYKVFKIFNFVKKDIFYLLPLAVEISLAWEKAEKIKNSHKKYHRVCTSKILLILLMINIFHISFYISR